MTREPAKKAKKVSVTARVKARNKRRALPIEFTISEQTTHKMFASQIHEAIGKPPYAKHGAPSSGDKTRISVECKASICMAVTRMRCYGWSAGQLASAIGVDTPTLSAWKSQVKKTLATNPEYRRNGEAMTERQRLERIGRLLSEVIGLSSGMSLQDKIIESAMWVDAMWRNSDGQG